MWLFVCGWGVGGGGGLECLTGKHHAWYVLKQSCLQGRNGRVKGHIVQASGSTVMCLDEYSAIYSCRTCMEGRVSGKHCSVCGWEGMGSM